MDIGVRTAHLWFIHESEPSKRLAFKACDQLISWRIIGWKRIVRRGEASSSVDLCDCSEDLFGL